MSIWLTKPDKDGKRNIYFAEIPYQIILVAFLLIVATAVPRYVGNRDLVISDSLVLMATGFTMYLASKISLFVKGVWMSWGPGRMAAPFRILYVIGIALMAIGILVLVLGIRGAAAGALSGG